MNICSVFLTVQQTMRKKPFIRNTCNPYSTRNKNKEKHQFCQTYEKRKQKKIADINLWAELKPKHPLSIAFAGKRNHVHWSFS